MYKNKVFWMNNLASCGSVWNWSFTQHPQFGNWSCVLYQLDNNIACSSYIGVQEVFVGQRSLIFTCADKSIAFAFWIDFFMVTLARLPAWGELYRRELWQGESLHSPCCPLEKSGSCNSKKLDPLSKLLLIHKGVSCCHSGSLLWQFFF